MTAIEELFARVKEKHELACSFTPPQTARSKTAIGECSLYGHRVSLYDGQGGSIRAAYTAPSAPASEKDWMRKGTKVLEEALLFADAFLVRTASLALRGGERQN